MQLQEKEDNERHQLETLIASNKAVAPAPAPEMAQEVVATELNLNQQQISTLQGLIQTQQQQQLQIQAEINQEARD